MGPDVHRDPEMLRRHAAEAHDLADELLAALTGVDDSTGSTDSTAADQVAHTVRRAVAELRALAADLAGAAEVEHAEADALAALRRALTS